MTCAAWLSLGPARREGLGLSGNSMAGSAERMDSDGPAHTLSILPPRRQEWDHSLVRHSEPGRPWTGS